jgi:2-polyprenyl-6-methoxyphenol hydroxylase-like FAD-dependent oxidoreductase
MSPFAGEGANLAVLDGAELARALVDHPGDVERALITYEREMFPRGCRMAEVSTSNLAQFFGPNAPMSVVDLFSV